MLGEVINIIVSIRKHDAFDLSTHWDLNKMLRIFQRYFLNVLFSTKSIDWRFTRRLEKNDWGLRLIKVWFDVVRQQSITWTNVDQHLCGVITMLRHNELNCPGGQFGFTKTLISKQRRLSLTQLFLCGEILRESLSLSLVSPEIHVFMVKICELAF